MNKFFSLCGMLALGASATVWGANITISDKVSSGTGWTGAQEDNEVEPNCTTGQAWDLEAFLFNDATKKLSIVGGYNMQAGQDSVYSGDLFIDVNGDVVYGSDVTVGSDGYRTVSNTAFNYDYAIVWDRNGATTPQGGTLRDGSAADGFQANYSVYKLGAQSELTAYYEQNDEANPFRLTYPTAASKVTTGTATFSNLGTADYEGLTGGTHYALSDISLSWLASDANSGQTYTFHFTMGCGNDNLMGQTAAFGTPDNGPTVALLGIGLAGIGVVMRRVRKD